MLIPYSRNERASAVSLLSISAWPNEAMAFMSVVKLSSYSVSSVRLAAPYDSLSSVLLIQVRLSIFLSLSPVIVLYERIMPELLESNWLNVSLPELISGRLSGIDI